VKVGDFQLTEGLLKKIDRSDPLLVSLTSVPQPLSKALKADSGTNDAATGFYWSAQPGADTPQIGDVRIRYSVTPATEVSVMAHQRGERLEPFQTHGGGMLALLSMGTRSAEEMIAKAESTNAVFCWALRIVGTLLAIVGTSLVLQPIASLTSWFPVVGQLMNAGTTLVATLFGLAVSLLTIGTAWLFYRPLLAVPLMIASMALVWFLVKRKGDEPAQPLQAPPPVPAA
jgi:uncharacterized membrane protein YqjE